MGFIVKNYDFYRMQDWYPKLSSYSCPAVFLSLKEPEIAALSAGETEGEVVSAVLPRLNLALRTFSGMRFVSVDAVAPTDTERFLRKRGAVSSAKSAWAVLAESSKVRSAAEAGTVSRICIRPFRRMDVTREFRLFIRGGKLQAMSQYWLIRHFRRLVNLRQTYWSKAEKFVNEIAPLLELRDCAMDIYFTAGGKILIVDINPWGPPTDPLMLSSWDRDWNDVSGCFIVPPPHTLSGDVNVSF